MKTQGGKDGRGRARRRALVGKVRPRRPRELSGTVLSLDDGKPQRPRPASDQLVATLLSHRPPRDGKPLVATFLVVFFLVSNAYWGGNLERLAATPEAVFQGQEYWRLLTTIAVHSDFEHWIANTLLFSVLGYLLYGYFGLAVFPALTAIGGVLTMGFSLATYGPGTRLVGASGVVYWMAGFWLVLYFALDRRFTLGGRLLRCVGFTLALLVPTSYKPNVSYRTHAIGIVLGALFGAAYFFWHRRELRRAERYVADEATSRATTRKRKRSR